MHMRRWAAGLALAAAAAVGVPMVGAQQGQHGQGQQQQDSAAPGSAAMSEAQRRSYAIGFLLRHRLAEQGVDIDERAFIRGFAAVRADGPPAMTPEEMEAALRGMLNDRAAARDQARGAADAGDDAQRGRGARPSYSAQSEPTEAPRTGTYVQPWVNLRLDARLPSGRIDTALPTTRENTIRANDSDDD